MGDEKRRQLEDLAASIEASGKSPAMRELLMEGVNAARDGLAKVTAESTARATRSGDATRTGVSNG